MLKEFFNWIKFIPVFLMIFMLSCHQESNVPQAEVNEEISQTDEIVDLRSDDCTPEGNGLSYCTNASTYTTTVKIPSYPNCNIEIEATYKICQDLTKSPPQTVISFYDVEILSMITDNFGICQLQKDIQDLLSPGRLGWPTQQDIIEQNEFFNDLYSEIYKEVGLNFIDERADEIPELTECGQSPLNVISQFYTASCYQICFCDDEGDPVWEKLACGNGCCIRTIEYCINETGEIETDVATNTQSLCTETYDTQCSLSGCLSTVCLTYCD
jgi:hypothetical protein